ncbi:MAG: Gfo/Idh/MocA family oxidoreductase [Nocardioides sp.]
MTLRIGALGLGRIVEHGHLPSYATAGLTVTAGADLEAAAVERFRASHPQALATTSVDELIASDLVDVLDIATPPGSHAQLIRAAVDAGKPVLCQKPLALTLSEARDVVSHAESRGVPLAVNHNLRFMPANQAVKQWLVEERIGQPHSISIRYHTSLDYGPWRAKLDHLVVAEVMVHHLDLTRWWCGRPDTVFAVETHAADSPDGASTIGGLLATYRSGLVVNLQCDLVNPGDPPSLNVRIDGSAGSIRADGRTARLYRSGEPPTWTETVPNPTGEWRQGIGFMPAFAACMASFIESVESGVEAQTSARDNLLTLEMVSATEESIRTGAAVQLAA